MVEPGKLLKERPFIHYHMMATIWTVEIKSYLKGIERVVRYKTCDNKGIEFSLHTHIISNTI